MLGPTGLVYFPFVYPHLPSGRAIKLKVLGSKQSNVGRNVTIMSRGGIQGTSGAVGISGATRTQQFELDKIRFLYTRGCAH